MSRYLCKSAITAHILYIIILENQSNYLHFIRCFDNISFGGLTAILRFDEYVFYDSTGFYFAI